MKKTLCLYLLILVSAAVVLAPPVAASPTQHVVLDAAYNPARHEFVALLIGLDEPSEDIFTDQYVLRRFRADGEFIEDIDLVAPTEDGLFDAAFAYDTNRKRFFLAWPDLGKLNGMFIDASTYDLTEFEVVDDPAIAGDEYVSGVYDSTLDKYHLGLSVGSTPSIFKINAASGARETVTDAIDGAAGGDVMPMSMAIEPNAGVMAVVVQVDASDTVLGVYDTSMSVGTQEDSDLVEATKVVYSAAANEFFAVFPESSTDLKAQRYSLAGADAGGVQTLVADAGDASNFQAHYHSGLQRTLVSFHDVSGGLGVRKFATDGTPGNVGSVGVTVDDDREEFISEHALSGESQCNTAMVAFTRETCVGDCVEYSLSAEAKVFGTPCLPTLTAEPNPLPLSDVGIVSVRANRGAFKVVSATLAKGASDYKIIKDECSGKVIVPNGPVCALHIQVTGSAIPGVLRVLTDADYTLDIKLGSSAVSLALVAPAQGATGVDPANAGFVWTASSNPSGYRVSVCKDAAMTQCETTTSVVRAQK